MGFIAAGSLLGNTVEIEEIESLAKGSLIAGDGDDAPVELTAGTNADLLVADSGQDAGVKWQSLSAFLDANFSNVQGAYLTRGASAWQAALLDSGYPVGFITGCVPSNAADADHDISFAAGSFRNDANDANVSLSAITKQIDATFAEGTDAGGLFSGLSLANGQTLHAFAVSKDADGTIDVGFDTSITGENVNTGWTIERHLFSFKLDGSQNIRPFVAWEEGPVLKVALKTPIQTRVATLATDASLVACAGVPTAARWPVLLQWSIESENAFARLSIRDPALGLALAAEPWHDSPLATGGVELASDGEYVFSRAPSLFRSNTAAQVECEADGGTIDELNLETLQYWIPRGQLVTA